MRKDKRSKKHYFLLCLRWMRKALTGSVNLLVKGAGFLRFFTSALLLFRTSALLLLDYHQG